MDILVSHWHCIIPAVSILLATFFLHGKNSDQTKKGDSKDVHKE